MLLKTIKIVNRSLNATDQVGKVFIFEIPGNTVKTSDAKMNG